MTGRFIHVNHAFTRHAVDHWHGNSILGFGLSLIAAMNSLDDPLDVGPQHGTHAGIVLTSSLQNNGINLKGWLIERSAMIDASYHAVNP